MNEERERLTDWLAEEGEARIGEWRNNARKLVKILRTPAAPAPDAQAGNNPAADALGNLLAVIFRDGGHRQDAIGNDKVAGLEAEKIVTQLRADLHDAQIALARRPSPQPAPAPEPIPYGNHRLVGGWCVVCKSPRWAIETGLDECSPALAQEATHG